MKINIRNRSRYGRCGTGQKRTRNFRLLNVPFVQFLYGSYIACLKSLTIGTVKF